LLNPTGSTLPPQDDAERQHKVDALYSAVEDRFVGQTHMTPVYSPQIRTNDNYGPYSKSASLTHWFRHNPPAEEIVINLDPDVILLRPHNTLLSKGFTSADLRGKPIGQFHIIGGMDDDRQSCERVFLKMQVRRCGRGAW
jgi:hypothetical protein